MRNKHDLSVIGSNVAAFPTPGPFRPHQPRTARTQFLVSFLAMNVLAWTGVGYGVVHTLF